MQTHHVHFWPDPRLVQGRVFTQSWLLTKSSSSDSLPSSSPHRVSPPTPAKEVFVIKIMTSIVIVIVIPIIIVIVITWTSRWQGGCWCPSSSSSSASPLCSPRLHTAKVHLDVVEKYNFVFCFFCLWRSGKGKSCPIWRFSFQWKLFFNTWRSVSFPNHNGIVCGRCRGGVVPWIKDSMGIHNDDLRMIWDIFLQGENCCQGWKIRYLSPMTKLSSTGGGVGLSLNPQMGRWTITCISLGW